MTNTQSADRQSSILRLPDGRGLGYGRYGDEAADATLFYFHGLPGSRLEARLLDAPGRAAGIRVVAVDRPGYGLSSPCPGRGWLDWPTDVADLADALKVPRFDILGVSGGGPFALACAHTLAARVKRVGLVCPLGPVTDAGLRQAMHWRFRLAFDLAQRSPALFSLIYVSPVRLFARHGADQLIWLLGGTLGGKDREILREPATTAWLGENLQESLRQSGEGALEDAHLQTLSWPFELGEIRVPVRLWHGDADPIVPVTHSRFMHERIPGSKLHIFSGEGHFSLPIRYVEQVLQELLHGK